MSADKAFTDEMVRRSGVYHAHEDISFIFCAMAIVDGSVDLAEKEKAHRTLDEKLRGMTTCPAGILLVWDSTEQGEQGASVVSP